MEVLITVCHLERLVCLLQVKLSLKESWAHASSLHMELVSNKPAVTMEEVAKQQKETIIKVVNMSQKLTYLNLDGSK